MKKCAHPYPGDDSAHRRLATLNRKPTDAYLRLQGTLLRMRHTGNTARRRHLAGVLKGNSDGY
jgi:hypothetical protein